jgi:CBS domain-containing protein
VDENGILIGIVTIQDIIQVFLPDFVSLLSNVDFIKDYGALKNPSTGILEEVGNYIVVDHMQEPISVEATSGLMRAVSIMHKHHITDLPITVEGKLVGIASRVDIGRGFLSAWYSNKENIT